MGHRQLPVAYLAAPDRLGSSQLAHQPPFACRLDVIQNWLESKGIADRDPDNSPEWHMAERIIINLG